MEVPLAMQSIQPHIQTLSIFGRYLDWHQIQREDWQRLGLPHHLSDQVFRVLIAEVGKARFFEVTVSEQCPKSAYLHLARGVRALEHPRAVLTVVHNRNPGAHLIFYRERAPITFHHLDLSFITLSRLDRVVLDLLTAPSPANLDKLFRLLDGQQLHDALYITLRNQLEMLPCRNERAWLSLVDLVLQMVFLVFVQRKGWLNFDHAYLETKMQACHRRGLSILHCLFQPLFARLEGARVREPVPLGSLPRLGGGMFRFAPEHLPTIPNDWCLTLYETLVAEFSFSLFEAGEDNAIAGVSPEVLGHVFENLIRGPRRREQGTYYTPLPIANKQVGMAFDAFLGKGRVDLERLRTMRILDPSCGSGTYLVSAFQRLLRHRLAIAPESERFNGKLFNLKRQIVQENLYGVDINPMAIRLTEVRLWLNMIQDLEITDPADAPALPNLQHHLRAGDFLARYVPRADPMIRKWPKYNRLQRLRKKFPETTPGQRSVVLRHIHRLENELFAYLSGQAHRGHNARLETRLRQRPLPGFSREIETPQRMRETGAMLHAIFSDVFLEGGFDLVIGNPPWLSGTKIPAGEKKRYRESGAIPRDIVSHGQADLAVYFVAASLDLLREGGHLGLLVPGKLLQAKYARGLRRYLAAYTRIDYLLDYGLDQNLVFRADTFPLAVGVTRTEQDIAHRIHVERHGHGIFEQHQMCQTELEHDSGIWVLETNALCRQRDWPRLGDGIHEIRRGIVTNAKRHFTFDGKPGFLPGSMTRPLLRGRDIGEEAVRPGSWLFWPYDNGRDWFSTLDETAVRWLEKTGKLRLRRSGGRKLTYGNRAFQPWLVVWKYLAARWQVALISTETGWIPDQTTYYIGFQQFETAYRVFAYLSSETAAEAVTAIAERGKDRCYFFYAHTCAQVPIPLDLMSKPIAIPEPRPVTSPAEGRRAASAAGWSPVEGESTCSTR